MDKMNSGYGSKNGFSNPDMLSHQIEANITGGIDRLDNNAVRTNGSRLQRTYEASMSSPESASHVQNGPHRDPIARDNASHQSNEVTYESNYQQVNTLISQNI